ncbi:hypothetical protein HK096_005145 [Nowakowskiella sp. JEL0078]|nr:hypothetical protein HK096_005145 [Nowakowskiella sp. JEL0078]
MGSKISSICSDSVREQNKSQESTSGVVINTKLPPTKNEEIATTLRVIDSERPAAKKPVSYPKPVNVLVCGIGEYTTGYIPGVTNVSDKSLGVVGLVLMDMRSRKKVDWIGMVGTTGTKHEGIRNHIKNGLGKYVGLDTTVELFPSDDIVRDFEAYKTVMDTMQPGGAVIIFTPDDTHFDIALYAIRKSLHVLITKPAVKTLKEHRTLVSEAQKYNVHCQVEFHKRFDPIYADAREKARTLGEFSWFDSYMSQPKYQLRTFQSWAGKSSDISYYLNSHHIDVHTWQVQGVAKPVKVSASASSGVATSSDYGCVEGTEDTISLLVQFRNIKSGSLGTAIYTSSWTSAKGDVHTQQYFRYVGQKGDIFIDQAHRGYRTVTDDKGMSSSNPLYLRYQPDSKGRYVGQGGYGQLSIESFIDAVREIESGERVPEDFFGDLPTVRDTAVVTAILEAGRKSLDLGGVTVDVEDWE